MNKNKLIYNVLQQELHTLCHRIVLMDNLTRSPNIFQRKRAETLLHTELLPTLKQKITQLNEIQLLHFGYENTHITPEAVVGSIHSPRFMVMINFMRRLLSIEPLTVDTLVAPVPESLLQQEANITNSGANHSLRMGN
jgi:hypothetical protein